MFIALADHKEGIYLVRLSSSEIQNKVTGLLQLTPREVNLRVNKVATLDYRAYQITRQIETAI
ncbi:MAG: hypothetical protein GY696_08195 [Gammaproteobacteria bacterium]|nr:hypothetical protein [Gammaproteobacteria bacterium]